jgi:hypothetical protein
MANSITLDIARINQLAAQFNFNPTDFVMSAVSGSAPPISRADRSDFLNDLKTAEAKDDAKAKAKAAKAAKEAKPKRAPTGYLLFCAAMRSDVTKTLQDNLPSGEKLAPMVTVKALAAKWKALNDVDKAEWNAKSSLLKASSASDASSSSSSSDESTDDTLLPELPEPPDVPVPVAPKVPEAPDVPVPEVPKASEVPPVAPKVPEVPKSARKPKTKKQPDLETVHESN